MSRLMEQLKTDHTNINKLLGILEKQIELLQEGNSSEQPMRIIREILDYMQQYPEVCHHPREEVLIDYLLELLETAEQSTLDRIRKIKLSHDNIEKLLMELYQQANLSVKSSYMGIIEQIKIFLEFYHEHIDMEETFIFPLALELFSKNDWRELDEHFCDVNDPLFSIQEEAENHYQLLHQMLMAHEQNTVQSV